MDIISQQQVAIKMLEEKVKCIEQGTRTKRTVIDYKVVAAYSGGKHSQVVYGDDLSLELKTELRKNPLALVPTLLREGWNYWEARE